MNASRLPIESKSQWPETFSFINWDSHFNHENGFYRKRLQVLKLPAKGQSRIPQFLEKVFVAEPTFLCGSEWTDRKDSNCQKLFFTIDFTFGFMICGAVCSSLPESGLWFSNQFHDENSLHRGVHNWHSQLGAGHCRILTAKKLFIRNFSNGWLTWM